MRISRSGAEQVHSTIYDETYARICFRGSSLTGKILSIKRETISKPLIGGDSYSNSTLSSSKKMMMRQYYGNSINCNLQKYNHSLLTIEESDNLEIFISDE